jgi:xanthine dehydrogenase accessory factor
LKHWSETAAILDRVARIGEAGSQAAIATVVSISGSAYRRPGAKLFVEEDGTTHGGVSGGCLEADVRAVAQEILRGAPPRLCHYDTGSDEETVWGLGLGCEGAVDIWVQRADPSFCATLGELASAGVPYAVITLLGSGRAAVFARGSLIGSLGSAALDRALAEQAAPLLEQDESRAAQVFGEAAFIDVLTPSPRLAIFGAGDDAQALAQLAAQVGFSVTVIDHRPAYLTAERFPPPVQRVLRRPSDGVEGLSLGRRHFAVVQTHALIHDRDWMKALLPQPLAYLGLLGPRARKEEVLRQLGASDSDKLYAPVGLDLGGDGPEQVAISIVAEMLAVLAGREPGHLRARKRGIHEP